MQQSETAEQSSAWEWSDHPALLLLVLGMACLVAPVLALLAAWQSPTGRGNLSLYADLAWAATGFFELLAVVLLAIAAIRSRGCARVLGVVGGALVGLGFLAYLQTGGGMTVGSPLDSRSAWYVPLLFLTYFGIVAGLEILLASLPGLLTWRWRDAPP